MTTSSITNYQVFNHPVLIATAIGLTATVLTGSYTVGAVAAGAIYLISKSFAAKNAPSNSQSNATGLAKKIEQYAQRDGFIWFYKKEENSMTAVFGNFHIHPLTYNGRIYQCAEAAFQAQKFENTPNVMKQFENLDGDEAWRLARDYTKSWGQPQKMAWQKQSLRVMSEVLEAKFNAETLRPILLATGSAYLVEHIPVKGRDSFYGDDFDGSGQNQLGKILMDTRAKFGGIGRMNAPAKYLQNVKKLQ